MTSQHVLSIFDGEKTHESKLGSIFELSVTNFAILKKLSLKKVTLEPRAFREPHWHANANELAYCIKGHLFVSVLDNGSKFSSFTISEGEMFHIDSGALHYIENIGEETAELISAFSHEKTEDFSLYAGFGAMSDAVLGNTYSLPESEFKSLKRTTQSLGLVKKNAKTIIPSNASFKDSHKFDVERQKPPLDLAWGSAKLCKQQYFPALKDLSMNSLRINDKGMREVHWHPETAEMGYVYKGHGRMTILDPDGSTDTFELKPGDTYFIPRAYPHQIEVLGTEEIHFLIFFDQPNSGDIGYCASGSAFSKDVFASLFGVSEEQMPTFPFTTENPLIVAKINPTL